MPGLPLPLDDVRLRQCIRDAAGETDACSRRPTEAYLAPSVASMAWRKTLRNPSRAYSPLRLALTKSVSQGIEPLGSEKMQLKWHWSLRVCAKSRRAASAHQ
jgi:hypothetical protein